MDWPTIAAIASALGAGALVKYVVDRLVGRKDRKLTLDVQLVGAAGELLAGAQAQVASLRREVDDLVTRLDELEEENTRLKRDNSRLLDAVEATEDWADQIRSLSNKNDRLRRRVKVLEDILREEGIPVHEEATNGGSE